MAIVDVKSTIGALLIGVLISFFLFGILTLQVYLYFSNFPDDKLALKCMVGIVWLCELGHIICFSQAIYYLAIIGYGDPGFLLRSPNSISMAILLSGIISLIIQSFFAHRIRIVSEGRLVIPVLCWFLSVIRFVLSTVATVKGVEMITIHQYESQSKWVLTTILSISVANDVIIAAFLCYYLHKRRAQSIKRTVHAIDQIIRFTAETGVLTGVGNILMLTFFIVMPSNFIWLSVFSFLARLYSNTLLASLNARTRLRHNSIIDSTTVPSAIRARDPGSETMSNNQSVQVKMSTLREVFNDFDHNSEHCTEFSKHPRSIE